MLGKRGLSSQAARTNITPNQNATMPLQRSGLANGLNRYIACDMPTNNGNEAKNKIFPMESNAESNNKKPKLENKRPKPHKSIPALLFSFKAIIGNFNV